MSFTRKSILAPTPTTVRSQSVHLGGDPKGTNFLYANGKTVFIRNIDNPAIAAEYTEHTCQATVARYSPSGFYIASGDVQGNIRIWDPSRETNNLKLETRIIAGRINDIAWDSESKRIIGVGDGKERYGHAFLYDTGSSVGEISGHSKVVNSVSIRPNRPYKAVTCGDDFKVNFYNGPPFKFESSTSEHTRFVQAVRFSPNGAHFVSVGADGKIFLYNGDNGQKLSEIGADAASAHTGGIYSVSWSPDSNQIVTASGDSSTKIWDIKTGSIVNTYTYANSPQVEDQQVGTLWQNEHVLSLSLSGDINYLDPRKGGRPARMIQGHAKAITAFSIDKASKTLYTGSYDGRIYAWEEESGSGIPIGGNGHSNQVSGIAAFPGGKLQTIGMDDASRVVDGGKKAFDNIVQGTDSLPKAIAAAPNGSFSVVSTIKEIQVFRDFKKVSSVAISYQPAAIAINPASNEVAIGGEDNKVRLFSLQGNNLVEKGKLESNRGPITAIDYSPDGTMIAVGDTQRNVLVYEAAAPYKVKIPHWVFHTARINSVSWSPNSKYCVSGSLDTNIYVWSVEKPMKKILIKGAHQGSVASVYFKEDNVVVSTGQDASIKTWVITHHQ